MSDEVKLFEFLTELNKDPAAPATHGELFHAIHLLIGAMAEIMEASTQKALEELSHGINTN